MSVRRLSIACLRGVALMAATTVVPALAVAQTRIESVLTRKIDAPTAATKFYSLLPATSVSYTGADAKLGPRDDAGPYVTFCVRSCDGYYYPIRQNALRRHFPTDARACVNSCASDARLFYHRRNSGNASAMVDLAGRSYANEPKAFAYRTAMQPGCSCKAAPWTEEAAARHRYYALIAKAREDDARAVAEAAPKQPATEISVANSDDRRAGLEIAPTVNLAAVAVPTLDQPQRLLPAASRNQKRPAPVNYRVKFKIKPAGQPGFSPFATQVTSAGGGTYRVRVR